MVIALIIFKSFFGGHFLIVLLVKEVIIEGALLVKTSLHNGSSQVLVGSGDCELSVFF
jgi:hypothetical protein